MDRAFRELRHFRKLRLPDCTESLAIRLEPTAFRHCLQRNAVAFHRPDQSNALLDLAVVEHQARRRHLYGRPTGTVVKQQDSTAVREMTKRVVEGHWPIAFALGNGKQPCLSAGRGMGVDRAPVSDDEAFGPEGFQTNVMYPGRDGAFDPSGQQLLEGGEQRVLQVDGQRQQAVEESGDRRQIILDAVGVGELQSGRFLERLKGATVDLAPGQKHVELTQRIAAVSALEVILWPK